MRIEVITAKGATNVEKGKLLERLAEEMLKTQGYKVETEVRVTASELDLLCKHEVSGKEIYVECKAHRDSLSANVLTNLLGTVKFKDYSEGWLISTGPLSKDAKGFVEEWGKKPRNEREQLSIYDPDKVTKALLNAKAITSAPTKDAEKYLPRRACGEWTLVISQWGNYWVCPVLKNGIPEELAVFDGGTGEIVDDADLFEKFRSSDTSFGNLGFLARKEDKPVEQGEILEKPIVIEVEHGEQWTDYRPCRPEHFVGRGQAQRALLSFFSRVKKGQTESRVFAIKGDSGIGKSSLVTKMRDVAAASKKPSKLFFYAVDVRAASNSAYVYAALIEGLTKASEKGFGSKEKLEISDCIDPLESESIRRFLTECRKKHELFILVFDQFEELYSKPELFAVFVEAKKLMFSAIAAATNIVLGFAWKTDSTVPQEHPAYHMWHQLTDHRYEIHLPPFSHADAENSIALFESELGEKLLPELKKYILESSQGYPWLLKKLCIHLYEQIQRGASQHQLVDEALDIGSLFDRDLSDLSDAQTACLKLVANNAPIDWYEVLEATGADVVQSLQHKRLLVRRGDKLNVYWDIFRDYVVHGTIPAIPFTYIPQSPSIKAMLKVATQLDNVQGLSTVEVAEKANLKDSTVRNIVHDLEQCGLIVQSDSRVCLDSHMKEVSERSILTQLRFVFRRHHLVGLLKKNNSVKPASQHEIIQYLKEISPAAHHHTRTWEAYASRIRSWFQTLGYCEVTGNSVIFKDRGDILLNDGEQNSGARRRGVLRRRQLFIGDASPANVVDVLKVLLATGPQSYGQMKEKRFRNACAVLHRFGLVGLDENRNYYVCCECIGERRVADAVWEEAQKEESLVAVMDYLSEKPSAEAMAIAGVLMSKFGKDWKEDSCRVVGNSLRRWACWLMAPRRADGSVPSPKHAQTEKLKGTMGLFGGCA